MKKLSAAVLATAFLFSCNNQKGSGSFTLSGELKGAKNQRVFLEEILFTGVAPQVLDTGDIKDGVFTVKAVAKEEGMYRLRIDSTDNAYLFINDGNQVQFTGDLHKADYDGFHFSGNANAILKSSMKAIDSVNRLLYNKRQLVSTLMGSGATANDSVVKSIRNDFDGILKRFTDYCFSFADTCTSPVAAMFIINRAPVDDVSQFEAPLAKLASRFPKHKGLEATIASVKELVARKNTPAQAAPANTAATPGPGAMAPDITMNDVNDQPFSLSQLRGKYVLVDFWASWCGPCREENPNVVAAFARFKDKNFTILGVSLDKSKAPWIEAIRDDKLNWYHISDLKYWNSAAVPLYGFDGIPYNVLVGPDGKIIAANLRGNALHEKLAEILK